jgi:hypothetical protein
MFPDLVEMTDKSRLKPWVEMDFLVMLGAMEKPLPTLKIWHSAPTL